MIHQFKDLEVQVNSYLLVASKMIDKYTISKVDFLEEQQVQAEFKMNL